VHFCGCSHGYGGPIGHAIIFSSCGFFFLSFFPRLFSVVTDWMSTVLFANLVCMSEMCCTWLADGMVHIELCEGPKGDSGGWSIP